MNHPKRLFALALVAAALVAVAARTPAQTVQNNKAFRPKTRTDVPATTVAPSYDSPAKFLIGKWAYRSFVNDVLAQDFDESKPLQDLGLLFGAGDLTIETAEEGRLRGNLAFGDDRLALKGWLTLGNPPTLRFQGTGATDGTKGWVYDYQAYYILDWPNGVDQRPAIVGTIVRTVPHSDGAAKAGFVATWIAVKTNPAGPAPGKPVSGRAPRNGVSTAPKNAPSQ
jgi:hypothetical protein